MNFQAQPLSLHINGNAIQVVPGTTVAAAMALANMPVTRISDSGQPRTPVCGMGICQECRVRINGRVRLACQTLCAADMQVECSAAGAAKPQHANINTSAAPTGTQTPMTAARSESCDVLIVGAGPAGLCAARAAASRGAKVVVLDENPAPGGQIWRTGPGVETPAVARALLHEVSAHRNIRILNSAKVVGVLAVHVVLVQTDSAAIRMHWGKLIVCTGARERLLPFPGWTLPGVTGAGGLQALIKGGMPVRGERIVIAGTGPLLLAAAATARKAGAELLMVAEHASLQNVARFAMKLPRWPSKLVQALQMRDASYRASSTVLSVGGRDKVESVTLQQGFREVTLACDRVACGYGLVPNTSLAEALGCSLHHASGITAIAVDAQQASTVNAIYAAGECAGTGGSESAMAQGTIAGFAAIGELKMAQSYEKERARWSTFAALASTCFALDDRLKALPFPDTLVCRCEDVSHGALQTYGNWTAAKIHTRCGMGACQGNVCGSAAQFLYGWDLPQARMPFSSARIGTLAAAGDTGTEAGT